MIRRKKEAAQLHHQVEPMTLDEYLEQQDKSERLRVSDLAELDDDQAQAVLRDRLRGETTPYSNDQFRAIGADVSGKSDVSPSTAARAALEAEARAEAYNRFLADHGLSTRQLPRPKRLREMRGAAELAERQLEKAERALERFDKDPLQANNSGVSEIFYHRHLDKLNHSSSRHAARINRDKLIAHRKESR